MEHKHICVLPPEAVAEQMAAADRVRALWQESGQPSPCVLVMTFGCQQNEADSEKLLGMALRMGYIKTDKPEEADLILVNTCAVREHAEQRALSIIGQYKHLKAARPSLIIGVFGCMVSQPHRAEQLKKSYPYVDFALGTASLHRMPSMVLSRLRQGKRQFCPTEEVYPIAEGLPIERSSGYRAWVSVMYGCNNFCSYCIVPHVRGRERSRRREDVAAEVSELVRRGYRDITLLGQNVNSYGKDLGLGYDFADLLAELDGIEGDYTLHFMTSHPKDADRKLIDVMAASSHVAHHFHLPLQAGSDEVLRRMNRHYTVEKYMDILSYIRQKMPDCVISSDIMVGFPTETEADFAQTLDTLRRARFDMTYSFIYSPRRGTPAADMPQLDEATKGERMRRLLDVQNAISLQINQRHVGEILRVLCDGASKNDPHTTGGRTDGNKLVFFDTNEDLTGRFLSVRIDRADTFALYGTVVK